MSSACFETEGPSQEDGCMYRCGIECVAVCIKHPVLPTRQLILMHAQHTIPYHNCIYNRLPEYELSVSKHIEDIKRLKIKISIQKRCIVLVKSGTARRLLVSISRGAFYIQQSSSRFPWNRKLKGPYRRSKPFG